MHFQLVADQRRRFAILREDNHHAPALAQGIFINEDFIFRQSRGRGFLERIADSCANRRARGPQNRGSQKTHGRNRPQTGHQRHQQRTPGNPHSAACQRAQAFPNAGLLGAVHRDRLHFLIDLTHRAGSQQRNFVRGNARFPHFLYGILCTLSCFEHSTDRFHGSPRTTL